MKHYGYNLHKPSRLMLAALLLVLATPAFAQYGSGVVLQVPQVDPGTMTMDGVIDEPAWETAQSGVLIVANWDSFGTFEVPFPDYTETETRLLWSEDTLYLYVRLADNDLFFGGDTTRTDVDQILIGLDPTAQGDSLYDSGFGGAPENAPDEGPYAYKVSNIDGIPNFSLNFSPDIVPADSGWVNGTVFVDESTLEWGLEAALYMPQIEQGGTIGFNIGGAQASEDAADGEEEATYAFYSWLVCENPGPERFCGFAGGTVMSDAGSFALLDFVDMVTANEDDADPDAFALSGAFPNPFRAATTVEYTLQEAADVHLAVYDVLGRKVATLVDGLRPAGPDRLTWDAAGLPAGLYFGQLRVNGEVIGTRKMQLIR